MPKNNTYATSNVSLTFTVSEPASWMAYSLDGKANVTIAGNTTLSGLPNSSHNLTVYATDLAGNTGASETFYFTIDAPEFYPTILIAIASATSITRTTIGLLYYKERLTSHKS